MPHSHSYWQEASISHLLGLSIGLTTCPYKMVAGFPPSIQFKREKGGGLHAFYALVLEATHYCFLLILLVQSVTNSGVYGRKLNSTSWKEEGQRICGHMLKRPHHCSAILWPRRKHVETSAQPTRIPVNLRDMRIANAFVAVCCEVKASWHRIFAFWIN